MKIRTDFVTNSSSSGFVVITVDMVNGKKIEVECDYDSGYGGYVWNCTDKKTLDNELSDAINGKQLLEVLKANIKDWDSFIIGKSVQGIRFAEMVGDFADLTGVKSIKVAEQTNFNDGDKKADAFEQVMLALQAHCSSTGKKFENLSEVNEFAQNLGVTLENYKRKIQQEHNMTQGEYYAHLGILSTAKTRFQEMLLTLAERYRSAGKKVETFGQLVDENPDLEVQLIRNYAQSFAGLAARELLIKEGIMYNDEELVAQKAPSAVAQKDPSQIPENIRKRMDTLFAKLDAAYPDKVIVRLNADHKEWAKTVTELYRLLGYESPKDFLTAYGYTYGSTDDKGGRPKKNPMEIIEELQRRYPNGTAFTTVDELKAANPDIASRFQSLRNKSNEYFGMPFTQYLRSIGLIK